MELISFNVDQLLIQILSCMHIYYIYGFPIRRDVNVDFIVSFKNKFKKKYKERNIFLLYISIYINSDLKRCYEKIVLFSF